MKDPQQPDTLKLQMEINKQRQAILSLLPLAAANIHHIDELLFWLSQMTIKQFNVPAVQFWANQANRQGQFSTVLRGMACQDISFPQNFLTNPQIVAMVGRIMQGEPSTIFQNVEMIFPQSVATLLKRYRLNYCVYSFLKGDVLLPPTNADLSQEQVFTPLAMVMLLLSREHPTQDFLLTLHAIFQNALSVAAKHSLLFPATLASTNSSALSSSHPYAQRLSLALFELMPRRIEDVTSSPLTTSGADLDRSLRRVYAAINGQRNVIELATVTHYNVKDVISVLKALVALRRIELYGPEGQLVDSSLLPNNE